LPGGPEAALCRLKAFIQNGLAQYKQYRSHPDKKEASSHLSSYLHHGHVSVHQVVEMICQQAQWNAALLSQKATGARQGFWNIDENSESFFDELIVWRELAYHTAFYASEMYDKYESLPDWAQTTLSDHTKDLRSHIYTQAEFESAKTHDELWNAAQNQLLREGRIHNYLRMLWGKKILEWSATPQMALNTMVELNNKYALDGCNPNSYAGIFWTLGRYDRPWPNRPIYGTVRCMSSENTRKKVEVRQYLLRYSANCAKEI
jgi:deoxyribodipyrimidine photo-lyase